MNAVGPCVSVFGSARTDPENPFYQAAEEVAKLLVEQGFGVITGGGPGIMEAGNRGAHLANGISVGLNINLPFETGLNKYIGPQTNLHHRYFFVRKVMFVKYAQAFVAFPGGFGTFDELFEVLTLVQTKTIKPIPIILFGSEFWSGMLEWLEKTVYGEEKNINKEDMDLMLITDDPKEVIRHICYFYEDEKEERLQPNYDL